MERGRRRGGGDVGGGGGGNENGGGGGEYPVVYQGRGGGGRGAGGGGRGAATGATVAQLKAFLEAGGTVLTIGSSTSLAGQLGLPVRSQLVGADGRALPAEKFYVPGSLLTVKVDNSDPLAWGMGERVDVMFSTNSPVFKPVEAGAEKAPGGRGDEGGGVV